MRNGFQWKAVWALGSAVLVVTAIVLFLDSGAVGLALFVLFIGLLAGGYLARRHVRARLVYTQVGEHPRVSTRDDSAAGEPVTASTTDVTEATGPTTVAIDLFGQAGAVDARRRRRT